MENPDIEWRAVDSRYEVSNTGLVRRTEGKPMGQWLANGGYLLVRLRHPRRMVRVHRLVAQAFLPNPEGLPFVNHINCVRHDNRVDNLEWCTQWQNLAHSRRLGRMQNDYWIGRRSPNAALTESQALEIRQRYAEGNISWEALGKEFRISKRTIGRIVNGESYV